jgi:hypothetical protein
VRRWNRRTEIPAQQLVACLSADRAGWASGLSKFHDRRKRCGKVNEHNAWIPRDRWLENWKKHATINGDLGGG